MMNTRKNDPVYGDETFISIQKSVGDSSDMSMETKLRLLYELQQTDTKIDKILLLRGELPLEVQDLEDAISGLKTRIANFENEMSEARKLISSKKIEIEEYKAQIAKYEAQKEEVRNSREYDSLVKDIESAGLDIELANKRIREATAHEAQKKIAVAEAKEKLALMESDLENKKKELDSINEETAKDIEALKAKSAEIESKLEQRLLNAYHRVRGNAYNKLAVVTVKRDACGGCFNKIPPQRQLEIAMSKRIIVCEYCGRIIVSSDFENSNDNK